MAVSEIITYLVIGTILLILSIMDIRKKYIRLKFLVIAVLIMFGLALILILTDTNQIVISNRLAGIGIGLLVLLISGVTGGQIGAGDGILLCGTGFILGLTFNLSLLFLALVFAALFSGILLIFRHVKRNYHIPFVPFIFLAFIILIII